VALVCVAVVEVPVPLVVVNVVVELDVVVGSLSHVLHVFRQL